LPAPGALDHQFLLLGRPAYTRLFELERALRCLRCGARGQALLAVPVAAARLIAISL
jgi:hypothetical protein